MSNCALERSFTSVFDAGPLEGIRPFRECSILDDLATAKHEAVGKSPFNPLGRAFQTDPDMEVHDNLVSVLQVPLGFAAPFGPASPPIRDVLLDFSDTEIGAGRWKALWLDTYDLRIEILGDGVQVIAIDGRVELPENFGCGVHGHDSR